MSNVVGPFPGTEAESYQLQAALEHHCTCASPAVESQPCPAHSLLRDARVLAHLIFVRRKIEVYRFEEWDLDVLE
jgi:hypothetical protein